MRENPLNDELVNDLLADAANLGALIVGVPDAEIDFDAIGDDVTVTLRQRGLTADVAAIITGAFLRCAREVKIGIESAAGTNNISVRLQ